MSQSGRLNAPSSAQARRMATISACAVGWLLDVTSFQPSEMIVLLRTMTAPNGPPLFVRIFSSASAIARCMNACSVMTILISFAPWLAQCALSHFTSSARPTSVDVNVSDRQHGGQSWTSSHRHHEETGEFRSIQVFDFVKHAPDHDTVLKRYETSLDAMATTRRPCTR